MEITFKRDYDCTKLNIKIRKAIIRSLLQAQCYQNCNRRPVKALVEVLRSVIQKRILVSLTEKSTSVKII